MPDFGFHDWLDAQLRNVPLPSDLLSRLSASGPHRDQIDARVDAALRDVSLPADLEDRLRRIARPRYQSPPLWRRFGLAASVFVAVGLGVGGYIGLITGAFGPPAPAVATKPPANAPAPRPPKPSPAAKAPSERAIVAISQDVPPNQPAVIDEPRKRPERTPPRAADLGLPSYEQIVAITSTMRQAVDARMREQATLGAGGVLDRLPDFEVLDTLAPRRGISPPRVKGYDLLFQLKHSEHPFVSPSAHADLVATAMPLSLSTASYDMARRAVRGGHWPLARDVRVEDFVAAQDYFLPAAPTGGLALHVAGCPSPLGSKDLHLVQLSVQSATRRSRPHPAARLVVAVEMSWQMRAAARWETTERALAKIAEFMTDADRLTLVGFSEQPRVLAQDATARELQTLLASGKLLPPSGSADFAAGIEAAGRAARAPAGGRQSRIVFLTASHKPLDEISPQVAKQALTNRAGAPIPWQMVSLADASPGDGGDSQSDRWGSWSSWSKAVGGQFTTADSAAEVRRVLAESLTGRSSTVATGVSLKLSFNPRVVTGYRLLGHEAVTLTGSAVSPMTVDLAADSAATGLYEMWIKPKGEDVVATAELTWTDPDNGKPRRIVRAIRRAELADSFSQAPPWFQQGLVAAKAAEALRGSYYAKASNPLAAVLELTDQVDPSVRQRPEFQDLLTLVQQAEKTR